MAIFVTLQTQTRKHICDSFPKTIGKLLHLNLIHLHTNLILEMVAVYPVLMDYPCPLTENKDT
jgi:hypothetical protein